MLLMYIIYGSCETNCIIAVYLFKFVMGKTDTHLLGGVDVSLNAVYPPANVCVSEKVFETEVHFYVKKESEEFFFPLARGMSRVSGLKILLKYSHRAGI